MKNQKLMSPNKLSSKTKIVISSALLALLFCSMSTPSGDAKPAEKKTVVSSLSGMARPSGTELTRDGLEFLSEMSDAANALKSYSSRSSMTVFKNGKTIQENSNFFFKKPRQIRAEELGPYKKGSVAVLLKNGKVKGHLGGLLSKFSGTVDADSDWVTSANGYPLVDSDFYSMSKVMLNFAKQGKKTLVSDSPSMVTGQPKPVYIIEMYTDASKSELMKRAYIDPQTLLPVEWFDYKDGKLFAHTLWKEVKVNVDIDDSLFNL